MSEMNRRDFMKKTGVAATITGLSLWNPGSNWAGANDRVRVAVAGIRGRGKSHISGLSSCQNVEVVACDP